METPPFNPVFLLLSQYLPPSHLPLQQLACKPYVWTCHTPKVPHCCIDLFIAFTRLPHQVSYHQCSAPRDPLGAVHEHMAADPAITHTTAAVATAAAHSVLGSSVPEGKQRAAPRRPDSSSCWATAATQEPPDPTAAGAAAATIVFCCMWTSGGAPWSANGCSKS